MPCLRPLYLPGRYFSGVPGGKGRVIRACERCQSELDPSVGEWVAKRPAVTDKRGYHYSPECVNDFESALGKASDILRVQVPSS